MRLHLEVGIHQIQRPLYHGVPSHDKKVMRQRCHLIQKYYRLKHSDVMWFKGILLVSHCRLLIYMIFLKIRRLGYPKIKMSKTRT